MCELQFVYVQIQRCGRFTPPPHPLSSKVDLVLFTLVLAEQTNFSLHQHWWMGDGINYQLYFVVTAVCSILIKRCKILTETGSMLIHLLSLKCEPLITIYSGTKKLNILANPDTHTKLYQGNGIEMDFWHRLWYSWLWRRFEWLFSSKNNIRHISSRMLQRRTFIFTIVVHIVRKSSSPKQIIY